MKQTQKNLNAILRTDLASFIQKVFKTLNPNTPYLENWHIDLIAFELEQFLLGERTRLVINLPPRSLKSISVTIAFVAWVLGKDPSMEVMCVSYSQPLSSKLANDFRRVTEASWYKACFPKMREAPRKNTEAEFITTENGGRYATSISGSVTGRGADIIIFDDPNKADEVDSDAVRERTNNAYRNTFCSRLNDKTKGGIIAVQQRVHEQDLSGLILEHEDCRHVNIPAKAEEDEVIQIGNGKTHLRKAGDVLHPEREPIAALDKIKSLMGSALYSAQYQQNPVPLDGDIINWNWFKFFKAPPQKNPDDLVVQSWDTAGTVKDYSDYSACTTWLCHGHDYYLLDILRDRLEYPDIKRQMVNLANRFQANLIIVEGANTGIALQQELVRDTGLNIKTHTPKGDKVARMMPCTAIMEAGRVHLPVEAPGLADFKRELLQFPRSQYDDLADSVSQFFYWARQREPGINQLTCRFTAITSEGSFTF